MMMTRTQPLIITCDTIDNEKARGNHDDHVFGINNNYNNDNNKTTLLMMWIGKTRTRQAMMMTTTTLFILKAKTQRSRRLIDDVDNCFMVKGMSLSVMV